MAEVVNNDTIGADQAIQGILSNGSCLRKDIDAALSDGSADEEFVAATLALGERQIDFLSSRTESNYVGFFDCASCSAACILNFALKDEAVEVRQIRVPHLPMPTEACLTQD